MAVNKFKYHPNILMIKNKLSRKEEFTFQEVSLPEMVKKICNLNPKKASTCNNIPERFLKSHTVFG